MKRRLNLSKVRSCIKCGCSVFWDDTIKNPSLRPKKEWGWWREDLTKEIHWNRCEQYSKQTTVRPSNQEPQKIQQIPIPKFEFIHLKEEEQESIQVQTRELYEILQVIKLELKEENNPAVIGMIFNAMVTKLARGKKDD